MATLGTDGQLWDVATRRERRRWHAPKDGGSSRLRFSPDGRTLATVFIRKDPVTQRNELSIDLWDTAAPTEHRRRIPGISYFLQDLEFSPDGKTLAIAIYDRYGPLNSKAVPTATQLWDIASGKERMRFPVKVFGILSLAFSPDGQRLYASLTDQTIRVYDLTTGREITPPLNHENALKSFPNGAVPDRAWDDCRSMDDLTFSPDGSILAAAGRWTDYTGPKPPSRARIYLWDVARGKVLRHFPAHEEMVTSLSFAPDGKTIASSGSRDPIIRRWDVATGREVSPPPGHRSGILALAISPADGTVFTGGGDRTIRQWDPATGRELGIIGSFPHQVFKLAIAPDGQTLLVGEGGGDSTVEGYRLRLWSVSERREIRRFPRVDRLASYYVEHAVFSPDGQKVAADLGVFDVASGKVLATFRDRKFVDDLTWRPFIPIFFSHDGQQVITAEAEGARIWDVATGQSLRWAVRSRFPVDGIGIGGQMARTLLPAAISTDGRFLATSGSYYFNGWAKERFDPAIRIWDLATGQEVVTLEGHEQPVLVLAFSPDGRLLASYSGDWRTTKGRTLQIWDTATGRELRRLEGHLGLVNTIAFTPDGRSLVSGSEDATALVWDVSDLKGEMKPDEPLLQASLQAHWNALAGHDARAAYRAYLGTQRPVGCGVPPRSPQGRRNRRADHLARGLAYRAAPLRPWSGSVRPRPAARWSN